nr:hypothetical protein [Escherichia coli]
MRGANADDFRDYMLAFLFLRICRTTTRRRSEGVGVRLPATD